MNRQLTWLHLSDLHARLRDDWDAQEITNTLVADLKRLQKETSLRPDLVFFTGDLAYGAANGEKMAHQYQAARVFLESVRRAFEPEIPARDLYLVPGNHDVDRGEITAGETEWLRHQNRKPAEIIGSMRDSTKQWRAWIERLTNYRHFLTGYNLLHLSPNDPHLIWSDAREIAGVRIGIVGLNSAWSCANSDDKAKLWCGIDWQVPQLKQRVGPVAFSFALIHHPGNWFVPAEDPAAFRRLRQEFPIVLHGHEHQEWVEIDSDGRIVLSAGACYESSWMANGYSVGQIDFDAQTGNVWLRGWDSHGRGWVPREVAGKTNGGIWPLKQLPWLSKPAGGIVIPQSTSIPPVELETKSADEHYARRFCEHVVEQHDTLELFGCDIPRELQRHQLSVAYVSLNLSQEIEDESSNGNRTRPRPSAVAKMNESGNEGENEEDEGDSSAGIDEVLDSITEGSNRLMIRGPAGAGKSTLLRWCAIHAAKSVLEGPTILAKASLISRDKRILEEWRQFIDANAYSTPKSWRYKIPILVRLRDCPDGKLPAANDLPRFLAKHLSSAPTDWMTGVLDSGRALVLLDGVDEIHRDKRAQLSEEIGELIRTYPDCTYVVTTRPGAVERGWLNRLEFDEARVEPMSRPDREEFIEKWYRSAGLELKHRPRPGEDLASTASRLKSELTDQPELGVLASNPLLCAMICALYRERQERLPETPAELCESLIQMLLHRRERETPGLQDAHFPAAWRALQYPQKKGLLADLAWHMVNHGEPSMSLDTARAVVGDVLASTPGRKKDESPEVVQALVERSGLLRLAGDDHIDYLHNTLKEYLAGGRIVEGGTWDFLVEHADDPTWQPVILFALALAPEQFSSGLVRRLLERVPTMSQSKLFAKNPNILSKTERTALNKIKVRDFFLVRCRAATKRLAGDLSSSIDALTTRLFPPAYMPEVEALALLGSRIIVHQADYLTDPNWWKHQDCRLIVRCLRLLRLVGGEKAAAALASISSLPSYSAQVTGEWMMASSELCDATLPWPFAIKERIWADNTRVSDLRPLMLVPSLKWLHLACTQVNDLGPLSKLLSLISLDIQRTGVTNLSPLSGLPKLEELTMFNTAARDLRPVEKIATLKKLNLTKRFLPEQELARFSQNRPDVQIQSWPA